MIKNRELQLNEELLELVLDMNELRGATEFFQRNYKTDWSKKYGFGYPGEALERFHERGIEKRQQSLRSFVLAACVTYGMEYEHYEKQVEQFANAVSQTKGYEQDGFLQLLVGIWNAKRDNNQKWENEFLAHLKTNEEKIAALHVMEFFRYDVKLEYNTTSICILELISVEEMVKMDIYKRVAMMKPCVQVYEVIRPKKSDCKAFLPMYDFLLHAWRLAKKELKLNVLEPNWEEGIEAYTKALQCSSQDVVAIQYFLFQWQREWVKLSLNARERVFHEFLKIHLTSEEAVNEDFKTEVRNTNLSKKNIEEWISYIGNDENLLFVQEISDDFKHFNATLSLLSILDHPLFHKENGEAFIKHAVTKGVKDISIHELKAFSDEAYDIKFKENAKFETWALVERKRKEWKVTTYYSEPIENDYLQILFDLGMYDVNDYDAMKEVDLKDEYKRYIKQLQDKDEYLRLLAMIPVEDREFMASSSGGYGYSREKNYFDNSMYLAVSDKQAYFTLLLETMYYHIPHRYADELYSLLGNQDIVKHLGLEQEDVQEYMEYAKEEDLFYSGHIKSTIKEKFMTEKEKFQRDKEKFVEDLKKSSNTFNIQYRLSTLEKYLTDEDVLAALVTVVETMTYQFHDDLKTLYIWVQEQIANKTLPEYVIQVMTKRIDELIIENEKISEKELQYKLYAYNVLENHKKEQEKVEEENALCQQ